MGYVIYGLIIALIVSFFVRQTLPAKGVHQLSTLDLKERLNHRNCQFIDVRTPQEFKANHIRGFKNIPLGSLKDYETKLSKEKEIVVICQTGARSNMATKMLKKRGFSKLANVRGGMSAWRD